MPINIIDNFNVNVSKSIDSRLVVANLAARNAISYKYDGLKVFQQDDRKTYTWNSGSFNWSFDNDNLGDGYIPKFSPIGFTNSAIYSTASGIGINTNDPKEVFQVNNSIYPIGSEPLTINMQYSEPIIAYNWYYDGADQTFNSLKGSTKLSFGDSDFAISLRNPGDSAGSFITPLYMNVDGNVGIGTTNLFQINAGVNIFPGQLPKMEIITGDSSGGYGEFITLRHTAANGLSAPRGVGYLMKLSSEGGVPESSRMGGVMIESTSGYADSPSLYLLTNDQKRLEINSNGDIRTQYDKYLHIPGATGPGSLRLGNDLYPVYMDSVAIAQGSYVAPTNMYSDNPVLKSIDVFSFAYAGSTIQVEATFTGRLQFYAPGSTAISASTKIVALFACDSLGTITPVGSQSVVFSGDDDIYVDFSLGYGSIDYSTPGYINLLGGLYSIDGGLSGQSFNIYEMVDYSIRILY